MPNVQQSEAVSRFQRRQGQPSGESRSTERLAEVISLPLKQSAGISGQADLFARHLVVAVSELLQAEALQRHREWLSGLISEPRRREPTFQEYLPRLERSLLDSLREQPVEDGVTHPGEAVLRTALRSYGAEVRAWLTDRVTSRSSAERAPLLRLVGRMPRLQVAPWGFSLVATALKDEDLEVRDAAIKALELWRGPVALKILGEHVESERWLADHLRRVLEELKREV